MVRFHLALKWQNWHRIFVNNSTTNIFSYCFLYFHMSLYVITCHFCQKMPSGNAPKVGWPDRTEGKKGRQTQKIFASKKKKRSPQCCLCLKTNFSNHFQKKKDKLGREKDASQISEKKDMSLQKRTSGHPNHKKKIFISKIFFFNYQVFLFLI